MSKEQDIIYSVVLGDGPIIAAAVHDGHAVRDEVDGLLLISDADRLREEDPFTASWVDVVPTRIVGLRSRFEVDLNRERTKAVYIQPEDAWGLNVWKQVPSPALVNRSLAEYDDFYARIKALCHESESRYGHFVILDLHTYNHRRSGPDGEAADPAGNPEVNLGTGTLNREQWAPVIDRFTSDLKSFDFMGRNLDVRENVKFRGGFFSRFIHENFPESGCSLAIEFKKFFMDEWTGQPDESALTAIQEALRSTIPGLRASLTDVGRQ